MGKTVRDSGKETIGTIILAAGASSRMGRPKQLLQWQGMSLLRRTVNIALELDGGPVAVVLGAGKDQLEAELKGLPILLVYNPEWKKGMGTSLRAGVKALLKEAPALSAVIVLLVDQPLIGSGHLRQLTGLWASSGSPLVAARYAGTMGVPALFARPLFPELLAIGDATGAKKLIERHPEAATLDLPAAALDLDTPEDWTRFKDGMA